MTAIQPVSDNQLRPIETVFQELVAQVERTVAPSSARVYRQTFALWAEWCGGHALSPFDLLPIHVSDFLAQQDITKATRQRQLSALRKFAQMHFILTPNDDTRRIHEALKVVKAPGSQNGSEGSERERKALAPREADKLLRVWDGDTVKGARNRALVAVLLLGGIRRSEAAALRWRDVDFENGILNVRHGKGDKERDVPLAGDYAVEALDVWRNKQGAGREFVFCPLERGDGIGRDKPITGTDVYRDSTARRRAARTRTLDAVAHCPLRLPLPHAARERGNDLGDGGAATAGTSLYRPALRPRWV